MSIVYQVGTGAGQGGQTTLQLSDDGAMLVRNVSEAQGDRLFVGRVEASTVDDLYKLIVQAELWEQPQRESALPDEAPITLVVHQGQQPAQQRTLWASQFEATPTLARLKEVLDSYVYEVSEGQVP